MSKNKLLSKTIKKVKIKNIIPKLNKIKLTLKKKTSKKKNNSSKIRKDVTIIKSMTPIEDKNISTALYNNIKKNPKIKMLENIDENVENNFAIQSIKSFSPKINDNLVSLKTILPSNVFKCNTLLETNINNKCLNYTSKLVHNKLLKNLTASKHLNCSKFIAPKQYNSNCWFNTMFVTFFFSDKGRKFFRFMRQLMITGKKINGEIIPDELAKVFFIFNKIIEASYNQDGNSNYKLISNYNTNFFIENLYNILLKKNIVTYKKNQSGNPLEYYLSIIKYLNYDAVNILNLDIYSNNDFNNINKKILSTNIPEIIIIEIIDEYSSKINNRPEILDVLINKKNYKYKLDAAIVRDVSKQHFCSLLTCNNYGYSFDGASYSRLSKYNWLDTINKKISWGFEGHPLKWNFMTSYQMLFYYRI